MPTPTATPPPPTHTQPPQSSCAGDCDEDGVVVVNELVRGVAMALRAPGFITPCAALDRNNDANISIDELVTAIRNALDGCGG